MRARVLPATDLLALADAAAVLQRGGPRRLPHRDGLRARGRRLQLPRGRAHLRGQGAAVLRSADRAPGRGRLARLGGGRRRPARHAAGGPLLAGAFDARAEASPRASRHRDGRPGHGRGARPGAPCGAGADRRGRHAARRPERQPVRLREPHHRRARGGAARRRGRPGPGRRPVPRGARVHDPVARRRPRDPAPGRPAARGARGGARDVAAARRVEPSARSPPASSRSTTRPAPRSSCSPAGRRRRLPGRDAWACSPSGRPAAQGFAAVEVLAPDGAMETAAARLFAALRRLDALGLDRILAEPCEETGLGHAIMDRLRRAAAGVRS